MAYTRPCNKCGQRISLREMPHGQWVAFDVSTEETHVCGVQHEPDVAVKLKGKNKFRDKEDESIDIGYDSDEGSDDLDEIEEESQLLLSRIDHETYIKKLEDNCDENNIPISESDYEHGQRHELVN